MALSSQKSYETGFDPNGKWPSPLDIDSSFCGQGVQIKSAWGLRDKIMSTLGHIMGIWFKEQVMAKLWVNLEWSVFSCSNSWEIHSFLSFVFVNSPVPLKITLRNKMKHRKHQKTMILPVNLVFLVCFSFIFLWSMFFCCFGPPVTASPV